jgi:hypothetical protein
MERCGEGINWKLNDEILTSPNVEEGTEVFQKKIMELLKEETPEVPG